MFLTYVALTVLGLLASRVVIYLLLGKVVLPDKPAHRKQFKNCAAESLHMAIELHLDANELYDQLSGKVQHR